jgi:hypothetical protein
MGIEFGLRPAVPSRQREVEAEPNSLSRGFNVSVERRYSAPRSF